MDRTEGPVNQIISWTIGFILTGYVFHDLTWEDYQDASLSRVLVGLTGFVAFCLTTIYVIWIIPGNIQMIILGILGFMIGVLPPIFIIHWGVTKYIERTE